MDWFVDAFVVAIVIGINSMDRVLNCDFIEKFFSRVRVLVLVVGSFGPSVGMVGLVMVVGSPVLGAGSSKNPEFYRFVIGSGFHSLLFVRKFHLG